MSLRRSTWLSYDNVFEISSAFERTQLQCFDRCHGGPHAYSRIFYRKLEQKTVDQDLTIALRQCLKDSLDPFD